MTAQVQHCSLKGEAGAGGRLVEQGGQFFVGCYLLVGCRVGADAVSQVQQGADLLVGKV